MRWATFFRKEPCPVCFLKDAVIERMRDDLARERLRIDRAETAMRRAVDQLLQDKGKESITPPQRLTQTDSDTVMKEMFAMFKDEDDKDDGKVRDVDNLDFDHR